MDRAVSCELTGEEWEAPLDAETEAMIDAALANARDCYDHQIAEEVRYDPVDDCLHLRMKSGCTVVVPVADLQGLRDADREDAANFEIVGSGYALHWKRLDVDFRTEGLAQGLYGNERWIKRLEEKRRSDAHASLPQIA